MLCLSIYIHSSFKRLWALRASAFFRSYDCFLVFMLPNWWDYYWQATVCTEGPLKDRLLLFQGTSSASGQPSKAGTPCKLQEKKTVGLAWSPTVLSTRWWGETCSHKLDPYLSFPWNLVLLVLLLLPVLSNFENKYQWRKKSENVIAAKHSITSSYGGSNSCRKRMNSNTVIFNHTSDGFALPQSTADFMDGHKSVTETGQ